MFRKTKRYRIFIGFILFVPLSSFSQDLEKDMAEIGDKMESATSVSMEVDVKVYSSKGGTIVYSSGASLIKSENSTKSVLGEMEFINTPEYEVRVDHEDKAILIFKKLAPSDSKVPKTEQVEFDMEVLKKLIESEEGSQKKPIIKLLSSSGGIKKYSISGTPGIVETVLELDLTNKKIRSVRMEYGSDNSKGQFVVLNYSKFVYDADVSTSFNLANYFTESDKTYILSNKLKGYHIYTEL